MLVCSIVVWLAIAAVLLVLLLLPNQRLLERRYVARVGTILGRGPVALVLVLLFGVALGVWLCTCGPRLGAVLADGEPCLRWLVYLTALLVLALVALVLAVAGCAERRGFLSLWSAATSNATRRSLFARAAQRSPGPLLVALAAAILVVAVRCCGAPLREILFGDRFARMFGLLVIAGVLLVAVAAIARRSGDGPSTCGRVRAQLVIALLLAIASLTVLVRCCDHLGRRDLAMVAIWWDGEREGERGVHLRWAFRYGLPFPEGGFDLYRRSSGSGSWMKINDAPIHPALIWTDGAPAPGPMWGGRAVDRLHPSRWSHFQGQHFDDLVAMLGRAPYAPLYFVQEPADPTLPQPASPYASRADRDAYLATYYAAGTDAQPAIPLAQWQIEPMQALNITALDPDIARLLGLSYIDTTADPATEYDYRIEGHWSDGDRQYTATEISKARTAALAPPQLTVADSPVEYPGGGGATRTFDREVALRWKPPATSPELGLTAADGIRPVRWRIRRRDLGERPCPAPPAPDTGFEPLARPADGGGVEPLAAIALTPEEEPGGGLTWPKFFHVDRSVDYGCYAYLVDGIDIFGRESPASNVLVADVRDFTGPPPPLNVEAHLYQLEDTAALAALPAATREALFPAGTSHTKALLLSWVWPDAYLASIPDAREFRVYHKIAGYETFSQPASQPLWPDPTNWTDSGVTVLVSAGGPLPARLVDAGVTDAAYYEAIVFDPPMAPSDDVPLVYGFAGVGGVDRAPFSNRGSVGPPVVIVARDMLAPDPPPIPSLDKGPDPTDRGAAAVISLSWAADQRYQYQLVRAQGRRLAMLPDPTDPIPACLSAEAPTCVGSDPLCVEMRRQFDLRRKAVAHAELYTTVSLAPESPAPSGGGARFATTDKVDATVGDDWLYAGRAIDPAGNVSEAGCPTLVRVRDTMPPRQPSFERATAAESAIRLVWTANPEADMHRYRVYRTDDPGADGSLARMHLVLDVEPNGAVVGPPGATAAGRSGVGTAYVSLSWEDGDVAGARDYYYRLVAVDQSGNVSTLSQALRARAVDTTPPGAPLWDASTPLARGSDATGDFVRLRFSPPVGDSDARLRIQRRDTGSGFWRPVSQWLAPGTSQFEDRNAPSGRGSAYRIQAMDAAGNVGAFGAPRSP